jgi:hypothetical protein
MQEGVMRLHKYGRELDSAEPLDLIGEINQPDQSSPQRSARLMKVKSMLNMMGQI